MVEGTRWQCQVGWFWDEITIDPDLEGKTEYLTSVSLSQKIVSSIRAGFSVCLYPPPSLLFSALHLHLSGANYYLLIERNNH